MLLEVKMPFILTGAAGATIEVVHGRPGQAVAPGAKLFDLRVNLSAVAAHDCPPVSFYRIALRDHGWLRAVGGARGDHLAVGARLALLSTEADEPLDAPLSRPARITVAGVIYDADIWSGDPA